MNNLTSMRRCLRLLNRRRSCYLYGYSPIRTKHCYLIYPTCYPVYLYTT